MSYVLHLFIMILIYLILGQSLNLLIGYSGLLSVSHAASYGIGSYVVALTMINWNFNFWVALLFAIFIAMISNLVIGSISIRFKHDYFILATLGLQMIIFAILNNWVDLTHGPYGIPNIPRPELFGWHIKSIFSFVVLCSIFCIISLLVIYRLVHSQFGRALQHIRDDELTAIVFGYDTNQLKLWAFVIAGGIAAIAGSLYAVYVTYIDPTSFTIHESLLIIIIIVIGGMGKFSGPIIGAILMVLLPEFLRQLRIPDSIAANLRQIIFGLILVLLMRFRPAGIGNLIIRPFEKYYNRYI